MLDGIIPFTIKDKGGNMKKIIEILKGSIMGIANVVPGLSGGTIAVAIGIYEKLIGALADIIKHPIKVIKEVWPVFLGILLGIVFSALGITYLLENYEVPSTMLFVGFILGSLPIVIKEVENKKVKPRYIGAFIVMMLIVISLPLLTIFGISSTASSMNPILMIIIGIVAAATMIVPGVSGSMVLMTIGYYDKIMGKVSDCIITLKDLNMSALFSNVLVLIPFGVGVILGVILMSKIMKWLMNKFKTTTNWAILGLIAASPFAIIVKIDIAGASVAQLIVSVITFTIGYAIAYYICNLDKKLAKKEGK